MKKIYGFVAALLFVTIVGACPTFAASKLDRPALRDFIVEKNTLFIPNSRRSDAKSGMYKRVFRIPKEELCFPAFEIGYEIEGILPETILTIEGKCRLLIETPQGTIIVYADIELMVKIETGSARFLSHPSIIQNEQKFHPSYTVAQDFADQLIEAAIQQTKDWRAGWSK